MQNQSKVFIGVDGGGSSTRAAAVNDSGEILMESSSGPSNPHNVGNEGAAHAIVTALDQLRLPEEALASGKMVIGIAGLDSEAVKDALRTELYAKLPELARCQLHLTHDLEIAHYAAFRGQPGVLIVAGTGSACYAVDEAGEVHRASGRSDKFDDPGSGFALAKQAIDLRVLDAPSVQTRDSIAGLAPQLLALAKSGNPVARGICATEAQQLLSLASQLICLFDAEVPVAFSGSLLQNPNPFKEIFQRQLEISFPRTRLQSVNTAPHIAAAELAKSLS